MADRIKPDGHKAKCYLLEDYTLLKLDPVALTDVGRKRDHNEDYLGDLIIRSGKNFGPEKLADKGYLFAVADGMGGYAAGEVASELAITTLFEQFYNSQNTGNIAEDLLNSIFLTNAEVHHQGNTSGKGQMGTTLTLALIKGNRVLVGNVGDSRTYLIRNGIPHRVTRDHSLVQDQIDIGAITPEQASKSMIRNIITRAIGHRNEVEPDLFEEEILKGDIILLCSDGLHGLVQEMEMGTIVATAPNLNQAAQQLIDLANERGGVDNISVLVIGIAEVGEPIPAILNGKFHSGMTATMQLPIKETATDKVRLVKGGNGSNHEAAITASPIAAIPPAREFEQPTTPMPVIKRSRGGAFGLVLVLLAVALIAGGVFLAMNNSNNNATSTQAAGTTTINPATTTIVSLSNTAPGSVALTPTLGIATTLANATALPTTASGSYAIDRSAVKKIQIKIPVKNFPPDTQPNSPDFKLVISQSGANAVSYNLIGSESFKEPLPADKDYYTFETAVASPGELLPGVWSLKAIAKGTELPTNYKFTVENDRAVAETAEKVVVSGDTLQLYYAFSSTNSRPIDVQPGGKEAPPQPSSALPTPSPTPKA